MKVFSVTLATAGVLITSRAVAISISVFAISMLLSSCDDTSNSVPQNPALRLASLASVPAGAVELPLDDFPVSQLRVSCRLEIEQLDPQSRPIQEFVSESCREHLRLLTRLLTSEMSPSVESDYRTCTKDLQIDEKSPFALSLHKACRQLAESDPAAEYEIGRHYARGWALSPSGFVAASWYKKSARRGHVEAQYELGMLYQGRGLLAPNIPSESAKWFYAAADQGHASSQYRLAEIYEKGEGVPRNFDGAARLYRKAAVQGNDMAMHGLAVLYARGLGVEKNLVKAYAWNNVSAAKGFFKALSYRNDLEKIMTPAQISDAQALSMKLFEEDGADNPSVGRD